jgi:DNA-binding transcriptional ArsR family regulator
VTVDEVLAALADPTRRRLLDLVADSGETTATAMSGRLPVSRQALVQHLAVLEAVGLVTSRRVGRERRYAVRSDQLTATARWMTDLAGQWDRRLAAIRSLAESAERPGPDPPQ